jgi:hypothetical protein
VSAVMASPAASGSGRGVPADPVRALQHALYRAAKADPGRRFHALYDKICRSDVLWGAWVAVRSNNGAPGIDKITLAAVEEYGVTRLLDELASELKERRYRPLLRDLLGRTGLAPSAQVAAIFSNAWASVRGFLSMEIFGSLPQIIPDTGTLYQAHIRTIMTGMGFGPTTESLDVSTSRSATPQ